MLCTDSIKYINQWGCINTSRVRCMTSHLCSLYDVTPVYVGSWRGTRTSRVRCMTSPLCPLYDVTPVYVDSCRSSWPGIRTSPVRWSTASRRTVSASSPCRRPCPCRDPVPAAPPPLSAGATLPVTRCGRCWPLLALPSGAGHRAGAGAGAAVGGGRPAGVAPPSAAAAGARHPAERSQHSLPSQHRRSGTADLDTTEY